MPPAARSLLLGQVGFFACLSLCVLIDSAGLNDNHGWSYYGGRAGTVVPYTLGFLVLVLLVGRSAQQLEKSSAPPWLPGALRLLAVLLLLDLATPDTVNALFYWAHDVASTVLFLFELALAILLVRNVVPTPAGWGMFGAQFSGGLVAMFSQLQMLALLGLGILVFQVSFGALLVVAVWRVAQAAPHRLAAVREEAAVATSGP